MALDRVDPGDLRLRVDAGALGFGDTSELAGLPLRWIGQERAEAATRFGLQMAQPDYHLFVLGEAGSGRSSLVQQAMRDIAATRPVPPDLCYLHNFEAPEQPWALRLPAGQGRVLRQWLGEFARAVQLEVPKRLAAADVRAEAERIEAAGKAEEDQAFAALSESARAQGFGLVREQERMVFTQNDASGEPLTAAAAMALTPQQRIEHEQAESRLRVEITRFLERARLREIQTAEALAALRRRMVQPLMAALLPQVRARMHGTVDDSPRLAQHLERVQQDLLDHLELFEPADAPDEERLAVLTQVLLRLRVNVVVDHHGSTGAPVIVDDNPLFRSLFGSIEYTSEDEVLVTDFSRIRAGSLLRAHGGFLMLHLRDLMADPQVWEKLRRFLRSGRVQIEEPGMVYAPIAAVSLQPEPLELAVKIVLIASVEDYYVVQEGDPEFARRFRCKVDFAESFPAAPDTYRASAVFVAHTCQRAGVPHCSAAAVAALIEESHRQAQDQTRQSAIFAHQEALVLESATLARARGAPCVQADDVFAALRAHTHRHDYPEQRLQETITDGERVLEVSGERVGQLNGLTVVDLGDYRFGFPVRVTASTHAGDEGLINIEREVELSGPIHDKGVMILQSHLSSLFAHIAPLALNAAVVFEQEYNGVEGDSASCAEFYALLSSLSGLPLHQGIGVTGAINQHGEMLPVGGINEKIEGFFNTCQRLGLDGRQGVLIPRRNRRHLMLSAEVVEAVRAGRFHVHTADRVGEGMELLTGVRYGETGAARPAADTVLGRAQATLQAYRRACEAVTPRRPLHPQRGVDLPQAGQRRRALLRRR